jgi:hypothetical protein
MRLRIVAALTALAIGFAAPSAMAAGDWQEGAAADWQALMAKAKQEGKVVLAMGAPIGEQLIAAFKRDTGLTLEHIGGSSEAITARVMREVETDNMSMDVMISGSSEMPLLARGVMRPIKPILMLPKVTDMKYWRGGKNTGAAASCTGSTTRSSTSCRPPNSPRRACSSTPTRSIRRASRNSRTC